VREESAKGIDRRRRPVPAGLGRDLARQARHALAELSLCQLRTRKPAAQIPES